ncbi:MAG: mitofusin [Vezdaea aestivalis]|nr:MAG: mitofusin [Vezdaea aestivalis]
MSSTYDRGEGSSKGSSSQPNNAPSTTQPSPPHGQPTYMTVGDGPLPTSAAALSALLDNDSGYGSVANGEADGARGFWYGGMTEDRPTPSLTPTLRGQGSAAATGAIEKQTKTSKPRPGNLQRSFTAGLSKSTIAESSSNAEQRPAPEPRLITPQIAHDFSILKLDLKLGHLSQAELVHSLEKDSIATLLDGQISKSIRHLQVLRDRIEDTSSKVLITGDVNSGKSTFCNALLRRKVLPEDQLPCTSIFCEVLDARENGGLEEVHAVHKGATYDRHNESTYDVYGLSDLEKIVVDSQQYTQVKVYVKDVRTIDESLLNNGVVDISIIDAPGLNSDSVKTTAVFARQEEIDVVVFVVDAANILTQSATEFISNAAQEKAYVFIVVNGFDKIRDRERCQRMILGQVAYLSPRTFKESSELVHFVSSNAIPVAPSGPPPDSGAARPMGSSRHRFPDDAGDDDNDNGNDKDDEENDSNGKHGEQGEVADKGKGKQKEQMRDFRTLESALRRFVLEKRARSKLFPAKTYLLNVLGDVQNLATVNHEVAQSEYERVTKELAELEPVLEESKKARAEVSDDIDGTIEEVCTQIYDNTRTLLTTTLHDISSEDLGVSYSGLLSAFQFAEDLKAAMLSRVAVSVSEAEASARQHSVEGVATIKALGLKHLGDEYQDMTFRSDIMFTRRRDALVRAVDAPIEIWDFFDVSGLIQRQEKVAGTGMAMTAVTVLGGRAIGGVGWIDGVVGAARVAGSRGIRRLIIPGVCLAVLAAASLAIYSIPASLPRRLSSKLTAALQAHDYTHANAHRISSEVRKVLRYPAENLRVGLQRSVEGLAQRRTEVGTLKKESDVARKYFSNLVREAGECCRGVQGVDLEGPAPGVAGGFEPGPEASL